MASASSEVISIVPGLQTPGPSGAIAVQRMLPGLRFTFLTSVTCGSECVAGMMVTVPSVDFGGSALVTGAGAGLLLQSVQSQHTTCSRQCRQPITRTEPNRPTPNQLRRQEIFIHPRFLNSRPHPQDSFPRPRAMVERSLAENLCQR